jgi:hypothetical protein
MGMTWVDELSELMTWWVKYGPGPGPTQAAAPAATPRPTTSPGHPAPGLQPPPPSTVNRSNTALSTAVPRIPEQASPVLTKKSLAAWSKAAGLSAAETADREAVQKNIMAAAKDNPKSDVLTIPGRLNLYGYTALTHLPEGLSVEGDLDLEGCTAPTALPQSILRWERDSEGGRHNIFLENTGLSPQTRAQLEAWASQQDPQQCGVRLRFS